MAIIIKDRVVTSKNFKNAKIEIVHENKKSSNSVRRKDGTIKQNTETFELYLNGIKQNINNDIKLELISVLSKL